MHCQWATNYRKRRWKQFTNNICPLCLQLPETSSHVFQCSHSTARSVHHKTSLDLYKQLDKINTAPSIITSLRNIMTDWTASKSLTIPHKSTNKIDRSVRKAIKSQKRIGVSNLFGGVIYLRSIKKRKNTSWSRHLATALLTYSHTLWKQRCAIVQAEKSVHWKPSFEIKLKNCMKRSSNIPKSWNSNTVLYFAANLPSSPKVTSQQSKCGKRKYALQLNIIARKTIS